MKPHIAQFEKVSFEQFVKDVRKQFGNSMTEDELKIRYDEIKLPSRATVGSAGYDFYSPFDFDLVSKLSEIKEITIPTGIRCHMNQEYVLVIAPRSGHGFKYYIRLANTIGIIDSDYVDSDNEGHIMIKLRIETDEPKTFSVRAGDAFAQGLFIPFGITIDDHVERNRNGGFGSTDNKE